LNPDYEGPGKDELDDAFMAIYQEVTGRLTKATKLTGTAAIIPNVSTKVT
jgi:hypothetical protein